MMHSCEYTVIYTMLTEPQHHVPTNYKALKPSYSFGFQFCRREGEDSMPYALKTFNMHIHNKNNTYVCLLVLACVCTSVHASMCPCKHVYV